MLDETGLESTLDWYLPMVERQAGFTYPMRNRERPIPWTAMLAFMFIAWCRKR